MKKDLLYTFTTRVSVIVLGIINSIFLTRLLGVDGKGEMAIFAASLAFFSMLLSFSMQPAIIYYVSKNEVNISQVVNTVVIISLFIGLLFLGIMHVTHLNINTSIFLHSNRNIFFYELLLTGSLVLSLIMNQLKAILSALKKFNILNYFQLISILAGLIIYTSLYFTNSKYSSVSIDIVFLFYCVVIFLNFMVTAYFFLKSYDYKMAEGILNLTKLKLLFSFAGVAYLGTVAQFLNYRIDLWFVDYFAGVSELGLYALAASLSQMIWILPQSIASIVMPHTSGGSSDMLSKTILLSKIVVLFCLGIGLVSFFIIDDIIVFLYGNDFVGSAIMYLVLLIGVIPFCISVLYGAYLGGIKRVEINTKSAIIGLVSTLIFDTIFIPKYGGIGAAIASSISYFCSTAYLIYKMISITNVSFKNLVTINRKEIKYLFGQIRSSLNLNS